MLNIFKLLIYKSVIKNKTVTNFAYFYVQKVRKSFIMYTIFHTDRPLIFYK